MYRFTEALTVWRHPFWDEWAIDDIDQYVETVKQSPIKVGIEGDYIVGAEERLDAMLGSRPFDYVVGSVHFLGDHSLDTEEYTIWDGSQAPDDIWRRYFETLASAARSGLFDILAHPDLVKVWGTGHPGGIATIHAGSAHGALLRLEQLILEVAVHPPRALIAEAVNVVVFIAGRGRARRLDTIAHVTGFDAAGYQLRDAVPSPSHAAPSPLPAGERS